MLICTTTESFVTIITNFNGPNLQNLLFDESHCRVSYIYRVITNNLFTKITNNLFTNFFLNYDISDEKRQKCI